MGLLRCAGQHRGAWDTLSIGRAQDRRSDPLILWGITIINFYKHHLGDYALATAHLSWDEDMAYTRMLRLYYQTERPLPLDENEIARRISIPRKRSSVRTNEAFKCRLVRTILHEYFHKCEDGWHQKRCDEEIQEIEHKRKNARENGKEGGRPKNPEKPTLVNLITHSQTPESRLQNPESREEKKEEKKKTKDSCNDASRVAAKGVWEGYRGAYAGRYHTDPIRNAKVNGQIKLFCQRVPADEAADIAAFYVHHNAQYYVQKAHPVSLLLADAEKLHTEWITGKRITHSQAREADKLQGNGDKWRKLISEAEEREKVNGGQICIVR